jgi:glycosyltransferase involved in cell wall biosynthesis
MSERTVLSIVHNHPGIRPGGAEGYALELHRAMAAAPGWRSVLLAKAGPPLARSGRVHEGTVVEAVAGSADEYLLFTDGYTYDWFRGTITDKDFLTRHLRKFLEAVRPDVVHLQHTLFVGYDLLREIRTTLPDAAIVYTLHEYAPICFRDGQMVRTFDDEPCTGSSPRACHECFPEHSPRDFELRRRFIQSQLSLVDAFVAPSRFLRQRYVEWGIPEERILYEDNGRVPPVRVAAPATRRTRDRIAFFGQVTRFKGLDVLLEAMAMLDDPEVRDPAAEPADATRPRLRGEAAEVAAIMSALLGTDPPDPARGGPHLYVHGANLDLQVGDYRERVAGLVDRLGDRVTMMGSYRPAELPDLMEQVDWVVVPSVWWENAPLVIQEAFTHGRPVICSDIGGMAEKVTDGVDGLHFRTGDARSLAKVLSRAVSEDGLWERLRGGISAVHSMQDHVQRLTGLYAGLLERRPEPLGDASPGDSSAAALQEVTR